MKKIFFQDGIIYESYHLSSRDAKDNINETASKNEFNLSEEQLKQVNHNLKKFLNNQGKIIKKINYQENNLIVYELVSGCIRREVFLFFRLKV